MIDLAAVVGRVRGVLFQPEQTLADHSRPVPPWRIVAREHTVPVIVASALISTALLLLFHPILLGPDVEIQVGLGLLLRLAVRIAFNFASIAVMAAVVSFFGGLLGGRANFDAAYVLAALSMTPAYVGGAVFPIPLLGQLAGLAGVIYSLVILYRCAPALVGVPEENRGKHMVLTVVSLFVIGAVALWILSPLLAPATAAG